MVYNIQIVNFNDFFQSHIERKILDDLYYYHCFENETIHLRKQLTKRLIFVHIIQQLISYINLENENLNKTIFIIQPYILNLDIQCAKYCDIKAFRTIIKKVLHKFAKSYPNQIIFLKTIMDLTNMDTMLYLFNKSNQYAKTSPQELSEFIFQEKLKIPCYKV